MKPAFFFLSLLLLNLNLLIAQNQRITEVFFEPNKSDLSEATLDELQQLINSIDQHQSYKIEVLGHTDNEGGHVYNRSLSAERAQVVKQVFLAAGLSVEAIVSLPMGRNKAGILE